MDDLGSLIGSFLGNPENLEKLKAVLNAFAGSSSSPPSAGGGAPAAEEGPPRDDTGDIGADALAAPPAAVQDAAPAIAPAAAQDAAPAVAPAAAQDAVPAVAPAPPQITTDMLKSAFAKLPVAEDDKRTMLLKALRPYMSQKRAGYVDTAMGILSLSRLLGKGK